MIQETLNGPTGEWAYEYDVSSMTIVWNSTTCKQCSRGDGESPALQLAVPLMALRVRVFLRDLDSYVARCARYIRIVLHTARTDATVRGKKVRI